MSRAARWLAATVAAVVVVWLLAVHWLGVLHWLGVRPVPTGTAPMYQLWSGFIPALTVLALCGSIGTIYRAHNCHEDRCWRIGKHKVDGSPWCTRHHEQARATVAASSPDPVSVKIEILTESIDALAEAVRIAVLNGRRS